MRSHCATSPLLSGCLLRYAATTVFGKASSGRGQILPILQVNSRFIAQKNGKACTIQAGLQPVPCKSNRLLWITDGQLVAIASDRQQTEHNRQHLLAPREAKDADTQDTRALR